MNWNSPKYVLPFVLQIICIVSHHKLFLLVTPRRISNVVHSGDFGFGDVFGVGGFGWASKCRRCLFGLFYKKTMVLRFWSRLCNSPGERIPNGAFSCYQQPFVRAGFALHLSPELSRLHPTHDFLGDCNSWSTGVRVRACQKGRIQEEVETRGPPDQYFLWGQSDGHECISASEKHGGCKWHKREILLQSASYGVNLIYT